MDNQFRTMTQPDMWPLFITEHGAIYRDLRENHGHIDALWAANDWLEQVLEKWRASGTAGWAEEGNAYEVSTDGH